MSGPTRGFGVGALLALVGAALLHGAWALGRPALWPALVHLLLFGWLTGMIWAVSYHTMPRFAARRFPFPRLSAAHLIGWGAGVALASGGLGGGGRGLLLIGVALEGGAALLFVANTILLFRRGTPLAAVPPPPIATQHAVDRVGVGATRAAALCLPVALALLGAVYGGWLGAGWLLAAEHLATLGWLMGMIVGVAYHILPRFSGRGVRGVGWARWQWRCHLMAVALMVPALGLGWPPLFALGALLMAGALLLFGWTVWPTLAPLHGQPLVVVTSIGRRA